MYTLKKLLWKLCKIKSSWNIIMALSGKLVQTNIARNKCLCLETQTNPEKICLLENTNLYGEDLLIHSLVSLQLALHGSSSQKSESSTRLI